MQSLVVRFDADKTDSGLYEFVKKGDPPVMGITKVGGGITEEELRRPRLKLPEVDMAGP